MRTWPDISGRRFGRLTAIRDSGRIGSRRMRLWECKCDCGNIAFVERNSLTTGNTRSCGCLRHELALVAMANARDYRYLDLKHGHSRRSSAKSKRNYSPEYMVWQSMIQRCHNPKSPSFRHYGGRGISVTKPWRDDFRSFLNDMGKRPAGCSIDRIDGRFGYFHANCRWATQKQQHQNRRPRRTLARIYEAFPKLKALKESAVSA